MSITELSVKKPVAVIIIITLVMGLGIFGYSKLGADLFPSVDTPFIYVATTYPGASADEIEKDVVKPIENATAGLSGIDTVRSTAYENYGFTLLQFKMGTNLDSAYNNVQQALGDVSNKLPKGANKPIIKRFNKNSQPIMMLSISGKVPYDELYSKAEEINKSLEKLPGVGEVTLQGAKKKRLSVKLDKPSMESYNISFNTLIGVLQAYNINIPAGELKQNNTTEAVKVVGEFEDINDIKNLPIPTIAGATIPLRDIAEVGFDYPVESTSIRYNDTSSIGIFIQKQSDANIVETANAIKTEISSIEKSLPEGIKVTIADDESTYINATLKEIRLNLLEGIITTTIVMFLFLKQLRASLIVLVSIPASLIATFFMMYVFHFTMNMLSMLALSVSIGILVDDSVVVLENIQRHLKQGKSLVRAAIDGRKEIAMAAISITLCDVVVFGPIAFLSDLVGKFFREFGLTVVFATLFSLLVSFTVTPMLSARLLKEESETRGDTKGKAKEGIFDKIKSKYKDFLFWCLGNRVKIISLITVLLIASAALIPLKVINTEFLPSTDQSKFTIDISLKPGSSLSQTDEKTKQVEKHLKTISEVTDYFTTVGGGGSMNTSNIVVNLKSSKQREKSQNEIVQEVRKWGKSLVGVDFSVSENSLIGRTSADGTKPVIINITGNSLEVLKKLSVDIEKIVKSVPGTTDVDSSVKQTANTINIKVDKLLSLQYGIKPLDVTAVLSAATTQGTNAGVFRKDGDEFDIIVNYKKDQVTNMSDIENIRLLSQTGQSVALGTFAKVYNSDSPQQISRLDRQEMVTVSANIQGRPLGSINNDIKAKLESEKLPKGYSIKFGGDQSNMSSSFSSLIKALIVSIILVYMILAILYESFFTPLLRMLSLPCGAIGAFVALAVTGKTLNLVSLIGLIMLDGLASKNGTLLIDYTNTLMKEGKSLKDALIESGTTRLRPILMTTVTMIVGMVPTALALGEGSEIKSGMAIALIGGMVTSTIFSPVLIPVVYSMMEDLKKRFKKPLGNGGIVDVQ